MTVGLPAELPAGVVVAMRDSASLHGLEVNSARLAAVEDDDEDKLRIDDFVPAAGGEWYGLLFDNPSLRCHHT